MSVPIFPCPNCGALWLPGVAVCPHCGYAQLRAPSWPPTPTGFVAPALPPVGPLLTGRVRGDLALGISASLAVYLLTAVLTFGFVPGVPGGPFYGLGFFVPPALYFTVRPFYPTLARGLGRGILFLLGLLLLGVVLMAVVALGLLIVCSLNHKP